MKQLVKTCRQLGIDKIKVDNIEFELGPVEESAGSKLVAALKEANTYVPGGIDANTKIDTPDELTEEQLLFYSAQGGQELGPGETI